MKWEATRSLCARKESILRAVDFHSGDFERAHQWQGDEAETESEVFQSSKKDAMQKLLPYARHQSNEAACIVIKADGQQIFSEGVEDEVEISFPDNQIVAHLHTHPKDDAQSPQDWSDFLWFPSVEQSHVIAPTRTFSLHKPTGWRPQDYGLEAYFSSDIEGEVEAAKQRNGNQIEKDYNDFMDKEYFRIGWSPRAERQVRETVCRLVAQRYGIKFRVGTRKREIP